MQDKTTTSDRFADMPDASGYLARMSKPLQEKLRVAYFIPEGAGKVLDVGCADGTITLAMAGMYPQVEFVGIDLDPEFIRLANEKAAQSGLANVRFERIYLRELLARDERFDVIVFCSVLHEFFSYGEGISSVLKALADAHELLDLGGVVIIRDMVLEEYTKQSSLLLPRIAGKVLGREHLASRIADFSRVHCDINSLHRLNHFLLKYMYTDNWQRELYEDYVAVTLEQYKSAFALLGMEVEYVLSYTIPFLANKWKEDFGLTDEEISALRSTAIIVAKKWTQKRQRFPAS